MGFSRCIRSNKNIDTITKIKFIVSKTGEVSELQT